MPAKKVGKQDDSLRMPGNLERFQTKGKPIGPLTGVSPARESFSDPDGLGE
jgi:hypothetical protein